MSQTLEALVVELRADVKGLQTSLQAAASDVSRFSNKASSEVDGFQAAILRARTAVLSLGVAISAFKIGKGLVEAGVQMEAMRSRMVAATGDAAVAADALSYVAAEADRLGLDIQTASNGFAGFAASALRAGLTLQQTKDIFTGVTEAAVSMRLPTEQVNLVFKALEQMAGKGTVAMEELRGQLGDALPGAFEIAAKAMGKTTAEFSKMVGNGEVMAADFLPRFGEAVRRELGGSVEEASQGAQAAFNRLSNAFFQMQTQIASSGLLDVVVKSVNSLTVAISDPELAAGLGTIISGLAKIAEFALKAAGAIGNVISAANKMIEAVGNSAFGKLFGAAGTQAIQQARQQASQTAKVVQQQTSAAVSGNYSLGTIQAPGESDASAKKRASDAKKAASLREQLAGQVEAMRREFANPSDQAAMDVEKQQETLRKALEAKAITEQEFRELSLEAELDYQERLNKIREEAREKDVTAFEAFMGQRIKSQEELGQATLKEQASSFAASISAAAKHNQIFFQLEKARAIASALIAARESVVHAYNFGSKIGGPPLGAAFAGIAAAAQAVNIAAIASTSFGSSSGVAAAGGATPSGTTGNDVVDSSSASNSSNKSVYITLNGSEATSYTKTQIRSLIESINDALGDGSSLKIAVGA